MNHYHKKKLGPHFHESIKYILIIGLVLAVGSVVTLISYSYGYPPFKHSINNIVKYNDNNHSEFINEIAYWYPDPKKDTTIVDNPEEAYVTEIRLHPVQKLKGNNGYIPYNYKDYYGVL